MCEQKDMQKPSFNELLDATGISRGYASDILNGKQDPSRSLAIYILRKTAWRHQILAGLTDSQIDTLEQIEPWTPKKAAA